MREPNVRRRKSKDADTAILHDIETVENISVGGEEKGEETEGARNENKKKT